MSKHIKEIMTEEEFITNARSLMLAAQKHIRDIYNTELTFEWGTFDSPFTEWKGSDKQSHALRYFRVPGTSTFHALVIFIFKGKICIKQEEVKALEIRKGIVSDFEPSVFRIIYKESLVQGL